MKPKTPPSTASTGTPAPDAAHHRDSALESIGKAITNAVWESSGEADKSAQGDERRAAGQRPLPHTPPQH